MHIAALLLLCAGHTWGHITGLDDDPRMRTIDIRRRFSGLQHAVRTYNLGLSLSFIYKKKSLLIVYRAELNLLSVALH